MSKNMSYRQASLLNSRSLSKIIGDRMMDGQGTMHSIRAGISDKLTSKMKMIKSKFDPINIGRMFGGRLGAIAIGKLTGRSQNDISYFAGGKSRYIHEEPSKKDNPLVTKIAEDAGGKMKKGDSVSDVLSRIYNLMRKQSKDLIKHHELERDLAPTRDKQREKWHTELLKALSGLSGRPTTSIATPKNEGGGILDMLKNWMGGLGGILTGLLEGLLGLGVVGMIKEFFGKGMFTLLKDFFLGKGSKFIELFKPFAKLLGPILGVMAAWEIGQLIGEEIEKRLPSGVKQKIGSITTGIMSVVSTEARAALAQTQADEVEASMKPKDKKVNDIYTLLLLKKGYQRRYDPVEKMYIFKNQKGEVPPADVAIPMHKLAVEAADDPSKLKQLNSTYSKPEPKTIPKSETSNVTPTTDVPKPTASVAPPTSEPVTVKLQNTTNDMNDAKIDNVTGGGITAIDASKTITTSGSSGAPPIISDSSVPVRIDDPTLQKIQGRNLRPV